MACDINKSNKKTESFESHKLCSHFSRNAFSPPSGMHINLQFKRIFLVKNRIASTCALSSVNVLQWRISNVTIAFPWFVYNVNEFEFIAFCFFFYIRLELFAWNDFWEFVSEWVFELRFEKKIFFSVVVFSVVFTFALNSTESL